MRLPFGFGLKSRDGTLTKDAKTKNYIIDVDAEGNPVQVRKRPGISDVSTFGAGVAQLLTYWNGVFAVIGDIVYQSGGCSFSSPALTAGTPGTATDVTGIVISPDGLFVYISGNNQNVIYQFSRNTTTGALTALSPASIACTIPTDIALSPDGAHLYAISSTTAIAQFSRNATTGLLAALAPATIACTLTGSIIVSADGISVYAVSDPKTILQFSRDTSTGLLTALAPPTLVNAENISQIAITPDGLFVYGSGVTGYIQRYSRNTGTGALTFSANLFTASAAYDILISPDGLYLYSANTTPSVTQYSRDTTTGVLTLLSPPIVTAQGSSGNQGLCFKPGGTALFQGNATRISQFSRNPGDGKLTALTPSSVTTVGTVYLAPSPDGLFLYATNVNGNDIYIYSIGTGVIVTLASVSSSIPNSPFSAQDNGSNAGQQYLMIKNSGQGWTQTNTAGSLPTLITDVDYPGTYSVTATSLTRSGSVATVTTPGDTNFQVGSSVVVAGATPTDYNGTKVVTSVTPSSSTTIGPVTGTIARVGTTATFTSATPHGFTNGLSVTMSGATQTEYNGAFTITWISATTFSYTVTVTGSALPATPATGSPVMSRNASFFGQNTTAAPTVFTCTNDSTVSGPIQVDQMVNGETLTITGGSFDVIGRTGVVSAVNNSNFTLTVAGATVVYPTTFRLEATRAAVAISSITRSGSTATVTTSTAHGVLTGKFIFISGATQPEYNGGYITVTSATTYTFPLSQIESPSTPATGAISAIYRNNVGSSFTYTILGAPSTPATGSITVTGGRSTVPGIAYLNGRFYVMDIYGVIYGSEEDNPRAWDALNFITAQNETGAGKYLGKSGSYVVAFKEWSTEFFYDAANPVGSPLSPVDNGFTQVGCASGGSVATLGETFFWISQSKLIKGRTVHMMTGTQQTKISTPDVERVLNAATLTTVHAFGVKLEGSSLYILTLATSNVTLVYDLDSRIWSQWSSLTLAASKSVTSITLSGTTATVTTSTSHGMTDGEPVTISGASQAGYNGIWQITYVSATVFTIQVAAGLVTPATGTILAFPYTESYFKFTKYTACADDDLVLHESDGHMYELLSSVYRDNGIPIVAFTRSTRIDGGGSGLKPMAQLLVIADKLSDTIMLRWSDDDCATYTTYRGVNLSYPRPMLRRSKEFRRRNIETNFIGNNPIVCTALETGED